MSKKLTVGQVGDARIRGADLASKRRRSIGLAEADTGAEILRLHRARVVPLPEPVVVPDMVNGRRLEPWEAGLYVEWAHRARRLELAMFAGLLG